MCEFELASNMLNVGILSNNFETIEYGVVLATLWHTAAVWSEDEKTLSCIAQAAIVYYGSIMRGRLVANSLPTMVPARYPRFMTRYR